MRTLHLPNYIVDFRLVSALRQDNVEYVKGAIQRNPHWIHEFFFHIHNNSKCGLFENHLYMPAKFFLIPIAFAILFDSPRCLIYLLSKGSDPRVCGIACDCPVKDERRRWRTDIYRLYQIHPFSLTYPNSTIFSVLTLAQFNPNATFSVRFRLVTPKEDRVRTELAYGVWEFAWMFWRRSMLDCTTLMVSTRAFIQSGINVTTALSRLHLIELMKSAFQYKNNHFPSDKELGMVMNFIELLLHNGCNFDKTRMSHVMFDVLVILHEQCEMWTVSSSRMKQLELLTLGMYHWVSRFRQKVKPTLGAPEFIQSLVKVDVMSLQAMSIRRIRTLIGARFFVSRVRQLTNDEQIIESLRHGFPVRTVCPETDV